MTENVMIRIGLYLAVATVAGYGIYLFHLGLIVR
jgi:hypothetical protein